MKYELLFFDLDGTLIDSGPDIADATNAVMRETGLPEFPEQTVVAAIGGGLSTLIDRLIGATHPHLCEGVVKRIREVYGANLLVRTRLYPGVKETLEALGGVQVMVTNKPEAMTRVIVDGLGLHFARIYGADTLPVHKPDPAALLEAMAATGIPPSRAVMIGDSDVDVETARRAGVLSCGVTYGYGRPADVQAADIRIDTFPELLRVLR